MDTPQFVHVADIVQRPRFLQAWERMRHRRFHWLVECVAEFTGAFLYTYAGVGSTASYVLGNLIPQPGLGSLLQVGLGYAIGVVLALTICASTSGGHFNPCVTVIFAIFRGFPWKKVPGYIFSQVFGAYIACLLIYLQWKGDITAVEAGLAAVGKLDAIQFTPNGPAGIFGLYVIPGANLNYVLANEFFVDFFLGLAIWACLDPSNFFSPPAAAPWIIGFAYGAAIWGFAPVGLAANAARDVGGRLAAMTIWGLQASGGRYAALAALTNFVATLVAATYHELFFTDTSRVLPPAQRDFLFGHKAHLDHRENRFGNNSPPTPDSHDMEKRSETRVEALKPMMP